MRKITSAIKREIFSTRINPDLVKQLKHLAVDGGRPLNDLLEEAIALLLKGRAGKAQEKRRVV
jgi:predicted transcriptional regulator